MTTEAVPAESKDAPPNDITQVNQFRSKLAPDAQETLMVAQTMASARFGHSFLGTVHLLHAIASDDSDQSLAQMGITREIVEDQINKISGTGNAEKAATVTTGVLGLLKRVTANKAEGKATRADILRDLIEHTRSDSYLITSRILHPEDFVIAQEPKVQAPSPTLAEIMAITAKKPEKKKI